MKSLIKSIGAFLVLIFACTMVQAEDGTLIVLNKADNNAYLIDVESGERLAIVETGEAPHEAAVSPDGMTAVVANYGAQTPGNSLTVIDLKKKEAVKTIDLGGLQRPHGIEFWDKQHVAVTAERQEKVVLVNIETGEIAKEVPTLQRASHMVVVDPKGGRAYTANILPGTVSVLDFNKSELVANIEVSQGIEGIGISPNGKEVWVANRNTHEVYAIDTKTQEIIATMSSPSLPFRVRFTPNGKYALIPNAVSGDISVFDAKKKKLAKAVMIKGVEIDGANLADPGPVGLIPNDASTHVYVNCIQISKVAVINLKTFEVERVFDTGNVPDGIAFSPKVFK